MNGEPYWNGYRVVGLLCSGLMAGILWVGAAEPGRGGIAGWATLMTIAFLAMLLAPPGEL